MQEPRTLAPYAGTGPRTARGARPQARTHEQTHETRLYRFGLVSGARGRKWISVGEEEVEMVRA